MSHIDTPHRATKDRDGELVEASTGAVYLIEKGERWVLPDAESLRVLRREVGDVRTEDDELLTKIPQAGRLPSIAITAPFYTEDDEGQPTFYYAERGTVYELDGSEEEVTADFGPPLPLSMLLPTERHAALLRETTKLSGAAASNWLAIRRYLRKIPPPSITDPPGLSIRTISTEDKSHAAEANVRYTVTVAKQEIKNVLDRFPVVSPVADVIWPGAVIQGNSLASGLLAPVQIQSRASGTITVATELVVGNPNAPTSAKIRQPTLRSVTRARRQMMADLQVQASAGNVDLQVATMRDEQQMSARLGVKLSGAGWNASADVNASGSLETSQTVLRLTQEFYTVTFEPSGSPARFFGDDVTVDMLRGYSGPGNAPAYIHQVTYGRIVLLVIESADSATEVSATVKAAWTAVVSGNVDLEAEYRAKSSSYNCQLAAIGVTGQTAFKSVASLVDALKELAATADYGPDNPGAVISYSARYLLDGSFAKAVIGPFNYDAYVRSDIPVESFDYEVWDHSANGVVGGRNTGVILRPGDRVNITAFGQVYAGWWFGNWFGPNGDTSEHGKSVGNGTKPLDNKPFTGLLYGFGLGWFYWGENPTFVFGESTEQNPTAQPRLIGSATTPLPLFVHINDDNVRNGDGRFFGQILVQRRPLAGVGAI
jgi:hypothetical protein